MTQSILITQCLQNDFVKPIGRYDELPNLLHVGHEEARRLLGSDPEAGPVARIMRWAQAQPNLALIHIRDWHDASDPHQRAHLEQFGSHCIRDSEGATFAFPVSEAQGSHVAVVDSITLNDFEGTNLAELLDPHAGQPTRVGLVGVWTEAKITFLAYELRTRYPGFELGVCSALAASSSRAQHFLALDQLERLLGVRVFSSLGQFIDFLGGEHQDAPLIGLDARHPQVNVEGEADIGDQDSRLIRYLFRDCKSVDLRVLDGGFSGNLVFGSQSQDLHGHRQVPHVVKIGPEKPIGLERASFERIESVLGNSAPQITDFADLGDRGAIKYRYASMGGGFSSTFQKRYMAGMPLDRVEDVLHTVFVEQLGRFYGAATREARDLLEYYEFSSRWSPGVRSRVEALIGGPADGPSLRFASGPTFPNLCSFYESKLDSLPRNPGDSVYFAYVHGDLNGANIIIDGHDNVWLIDFFHTHRGHILRDLIKLENDLLYIFTPLADEAQLLEAFRLTDHMVEVRDLAAPLPRVSFSTEALMRAWDTMRILRGLYADLIRTDRDPLQLYITQLRYAAHTLGFDESSELQRRWALYTAARCSEQVTTRLENSNRLWVNWLDGELTSPGRIGMTVLPGRRDWGRHLDADLDQLAAEQVSHVVCLVPLDELARYGVSELLEAYAARGLAVRYLPIADQHVCSPEDMDEIVRWIGQATAGRHSVLVHCVGGLGRSGTVVACCLRNRGIDATSAIEAVRRTRSPRAIESAVQEAFVHAYRP